MYFLYSEFWALINHLQNKYAIIWCTSRKKLAGRNSFHGSTDFCTSCEEGDWCPLGISFWGCFYSEQPWKIESVSLQFEEQNVCCHYKCSGSPPVMTFPWQQDHLALFSSSYGNWGSADTKADALVAATAVRNKLFFVSEPRVSQLLLTPMKMQQANLLVCK